MKGAHVSADTDAFVVVDFWRAIGNDTAELEAELRQLAAAYRRAPGVLSCDFTRVDGDPGRYMAVFRYANADAREAFVSNPDLDVSGTLERLGALWTLASPVHRGSPLTNT